MLRKAVKKRSRKMYIDVDVSRKSYKETEVEELLYPMIYKRKSFHLFRQEKAGCIAPAELKQIEAAYKGFQPLIENIKTNIRIVPAEQTTCRRGEEFCILLYSEKKGNYLQNIGYMGEQLDLYLASLNIGALWFGIGKTEEPAACGMDFVIMIAIAKVSGDKFRKDMFKSKRKPVEEIWQGSAYRDIADIVRFAPSACNTQPWFVESSADELKVYRYKKPGKRGIMPVNRVTFMNRIDMGIFLLFLDLCLAHANLSYERTLYDDFTDDDEEKTLTAAYRLLPKTDH